MKRLLGGAAVAAVVLAVVFLFVSRDDVDRVQGLAPAGERPFGSGDTLDGAVRGIYSDDGTKLAVISGDGLGLAERGEIRPVTASGSKVVDVAWFRNGATLLVAEGPIPTGGLVVVDLDGTVRGTVPLEPSVGFGSGHGMSVAPGGRSAVVTAVDRPALGREERRLVAVDLETGATRDLTAAGGPDEYRPFHLDGNRVAFTEQTGDAARRALVIDFTTGEVEEVAAGAAVVGVIDDDIVLQDTRRRLVLASAHDRVLATVPPRTALTGVRPTGGEAVVATTVEATDGGRTGRLRRIELRRPASP